MSASARDAKRLFLQAKAYHDGIEVARDLRRARVLYLKSAGLGNNDARINLGYLYFVGEGVKQNYTKAHNWYLSAARTGSKEAQMNLAMMYKNGLGVKKDPQQAASWLKYGRQTSAKTQTKFKTQAKLKASAVKTPIPVKLAEKPGQGGAKQTAPNVRTAGAIAEGIGVTALQIQNQKFPTSTNNSTKLTAIPAISTPVSQGTHPSQNASLAQKPSLQAGAGLSFSLSSHKRFNLPTWTVNTLVFMLLLLAVIGSIWFVRQYGALLDIARGRAFIEAFYAHHRDGLRTNYLKYPQRQNFFSRIDDPWALAMCVLMVRYAQENHTSDTRLGEQSRKVLKAYKLGSLQARTCVFQFVTTIQERIIADIYAYDCVKQGGPAPIQYTQKPKVHNVISLQHNRIDKQYDNSVVTPLRPSAE